MFDVLIREVAARFGLGDKARELLQIVLACALGLEARTLGTQWHVGHPTLGRWYSSVSRRPSFVATQPPAQV